MPPVQINHYKTTQPQFYQLSSENQQLQDHKHGRRCPPVQESNLYRTINTMGDTPQHKINNYRTTSVLKVPPRHKIKHFNTIFITEDAPKHKF